MNSVNMVDIFTRSSIRAFLQKEIPETILKKIVATAGKSPSWANTQPVKVHVLKGDLKERISNRMIAAAKEGAPKNPDIPIPKNWPDEMSQRMKRHARERSKYAGIAREDKEKRFEFQLKMYRFLEAPCALIFTLDDSLSEWSLLDVGSAMQNIIIAANIEGLGTCPQASAVYYPEVIRDELNLNASTKIVVGMAIGYPDNEASINEYKANRRPIDDVVFWYQ